MSKPSDIPDCPIPKPRELERIEKLPTSILNAMTRVEIDEHIQHSAEALAKGYHKQNKDKGSLSHCILIVSGALEETGHSVGGKLGNIMVGTSTGAAHSACVAFYPEHPVQTF